MFKSLFKNTKLRTKFNLLLMLVFLLGILGSGAALSSVLQERVQADVASKAALLMETMNSVRTYTDNNVNPLLESRLETEKAFIPETIPTFSVKKVLEYLHKNETYKRFSYKDATLNPTNPQDKADSFETQIVERFRREPETKEIADYRTLVGGKVFYIAHPIIITEQRCLRCHSTPAEAPKGLVTAFGKEHGFGWKLNEVVAAQIVSIPAQDVFDSAHRAFALVMSILIGIFALVVLLVNFLLKQAVIQRIIKIAKTAHEVSLGEINAEFEDKSKDEIGILVAAFNRMKSSLDIAMNILNQHKN